MKTIAVLALQGAFEEHEAMLRQLGAETYQIRQKRDWERHKDGLIIPGGESTTQCKLLRELGILPLIQRDIESGLPVFGTCAGLILLAKREGGKERGGIGTLDVEVCRNAYGRQLGSFQATGDVEGIGSRIPMTFIRAPYVSRILREDVRILAETDGRITAVQQGRQLATAFHPELTDDLRIHRHFMDIVEQSTREA